MIDSESPVRDKVLRSPVRDKVLRSSIEAICSEEFRISPDGWPSGTCSRLNKMFVPLTLSSNFVSAYGAVAV